MAAYSKGLELPESVGFDASKIIKIIGQCALVSLMYAMEGTKIVDKIHSLNFSLKHAHKNMKLGSDMTNQAGVTYLVMDQTCIVFRKALKDTDLNAVDAYYSALCEKIYKDSIFIFAKER